MWDYCKKHSFNSLLKILKEFGTQKTDNIQDLASDREYAGKISCINRIFTYRAVWIPGHPSVVLYPFFVNSEAM
jgi:hypothetical protein